MKYLNIFINYVKESRIELRKVNWPSREDTIKYTLIVIGMSAGMAAFLGALNILFSYLLYQLVF